MTSRWMIAAGAVAMMLFGAVLLRHAAYHLPSHSRGAATAHAADRTCDAPQKAGTDRSAADLPRSRSDLVVGAKPAVLMAQASTRRRASFRTTDEAQKIAEQQIRACYPAYRDLLFEGGVRPESRARNMIALLRGAPPYAFQPGLATLDGLPLNQDDQLRAVRRGVIDDLQHFDPSGNPNVGDKRWAGFSGQGLRTALYDALEDAIEAETLYEYVDQAVGLLSKLRAPDREERFLWHLGRGANPMIRYSTIRAVGRGGPRGSAELDFVCELLSDPDGNVSGSACQAAAVFGASAHNIYIRAVALFDAAENPADQAQFFLTLIRARPTATESRDRIRWVIAAPQHSPDALLQDVIWAVENHRLSVTEYLDVVRGGLVHPDLGVRAASIGALGEVGDGGDLDVLRRMSETNTDERCQNALNDAIDKLAASLADKQ